MAFEYLMAVIKQAGNEKLVHSWIVWYQYSNYISLCLKFSVRDKEGRKQDWKPI